MDPEVARKVCGVVAGLIETDGGLNTAEHVFLRRVLKRFGLRENGDDAPVPPLDRPEAVKALSAMSDEVRIEALELLIEAAIVDGNVVPLEQRFLAEAASVLGIDEAELEARLVDRLLYS